MGVLKTYACKYGRKYGLGLPLALLVLLALALVGLDSPIGHRILADWLETQESERGLSVGIGRIEGSIYGTARLDDVTLRDPHGVFLRVPVAELDWRPFAWFGFSFWNGDFREGGLGRQRLDIRHLVLRRGVLLRVPRLRPNTHTPVLPDFDIRIDRLAIEHLTIAPGIAGPARQIDAHARVDIHRHRAFVSLDSHLGGTDRLSGLLDIDEGRGRFALALDYAAPKGGLLAALTGARASRLARIDGRGSWADWRGSLIATQEREPLAAFGLVNRSGRLGLDGEMRPAPFLSPAVAGALGGAVRLAGEGRLADGRFAGRLAVASPTLHGNAVGAVDLHAGRFDHVAIDAATRAPLTLGADSRLDDARAHIVLDGAFDGMEARGRITAAQWRQGSVTLANVAVEGSAKRGERRWTIPLTAAAARVVTGNDAADRYLTGLRGAMTLQVAGTSLASDNLVLAATGLSARAALHGDASRGTYALAGQVTGHGLQLGTIGIADAKAAARFDWARGNWQFGARLAGSMARLNSAALAALAGDNPGFTAQFSAGSGRKPMVTQAALTASRLTLNLVGQRLADGTMALSGSGHQERYGAFTLDVRLADDGPHAQFLFEDPLPVAGVEAMRLTVSPAANTWLIGISGGSLLGPFAGTLALSLPDGAPPRLEVRNFAVSSTAVTGALDLSTGAAEGELTLAGGGVTGALRLAPRGQGQGQGIDLTLAARNAHFGGDRPFVIGNGHLQVSGLILKNHTSLTASASAQGIGRGPVFIGRAAAGLGLVDGAGQFDASFSGRRGSRFELRFDGNVAPGRLGLAAQGVFAGEPIAMPRRAVLSRVDDEKGSGWRLSPSEIDFGHGRAIANGRFGNGASELYLALADMPLALGDAVFADLGLGGSATGLLTFAHPREGLPTGQVQLMVRNLTRSGLVVTSRPIDLALVGNLSAQALQMRAVALSGGQALGRLQARIGGLPAQGSLVDRLRAGSLAAGMRYSGPADAPWRLMALDAFDLTGPIDLAADISGSLDDPHIVGSFASDAMRLQSAVTGTDIGGIVARGAFAGSRLTLATLAGNTAGGGQVVGSGTIDFTGITEGHGPAIDLRLAARKAQLLARSDMALTASGPMRIVSNGAQGTIAARFAIDAARWRLGQAQATAALPDIATREINRSADIAPSRRSLPWRFLIDAAAPGKIRVLGLGLDSEWGASIRLRGTIDDPAIFGSAALASGSYEFAGQHFDLTRGRIAFDGGSPPDPRLDIAASNSTNGITVNVTVRGTSLKPEIAFSSVPPLPEEDLLSRLLFGTSVTGISAPEAVQLGAALAALHGGGGLDPINKLRSAIGLDRLRIVNADPTVPHDAGVAVGKYVSRRFYVELMTDGHQYTATNIEYRITRWLSLLGSVSTINRNSVNARISHDY